jgi:hypothetical protein
MWRRENSRPYRDSKSDPSVVQSVASRYTDYAIPAPAERSKGNKNLSRKLFCTLGDDEVPTDGDNLYMTFMERFPLENLKSLSCSRNSPHFMKSDYLLMSFQELATGHS